MKPPKESLKTILAIDLGTNLGWAMWSSGKIKFGTEDLQNSTWDGAGLRFLKLRKFLLERKDVDLVVYENVMAHSSTFASHVYGGYLSVIQYFCEEYEVPYTSYGVGQIKKGWVGKGNAKKDAMIREAHNRGFNVKDDNSADALAILHMGLEQFKELLAD